MQYTLCISLTQRRSLFDFWLCFLLDALLMLIPLSFNVSITITIKNDISCLRLPAFLPSLSPLLTLHPVSCLSLLHLYVTSCCSTTFHPYIYTNLTVKRVILYSCFRCRSSSLSTLAFPLCITTTTTRTEVSLNLIAHCSILQHSL